MLSVVNMPEEKFITPEVNLLPSDDLESKPGGKFLKWSLSWGKKIVVLTELLVVLAFLSRFKLDSDVANLSEELDRRKTIILASSDFEKQFRSIQARLAKAKEIDASSSPVTVYDKALALIPSSITVTSITTKDKSVTFQGQGDDQTLSIMVAAFKNSLDFDDVIIEKVKKEGSATTPAVTKPSPNTASVISPASGVGVNFVLTATYVHKPV